MRARLRFLVPAGVLCIGILTPGTAAYAEPTVAQLEKQISEKSVELEKVVEQYNQLNEQLTDTKAQIAKLQDSIGPLEQRASAAKGRVAGIAHTAYRTTGINGLTALLAGGNGKEVLVRLDTLQHLAESQHKQIHDAHTATAKHQAAKKALEQQQAAEDVRIKTLDSQKKGIEAELAKLNELKMKARGYTSTSGSSYTGPIPSISGQAGVAVTFAYQAIGKPYVWAAAGPDSYDCSGLTKAAWAAAGVSLAHYTVTQWNQTAHISRSQLAAGDLVFYSDLGHVALYIGDGKVIHAPTFGEVVKISSVDMMTPYGYGRVR